jgi:hypothetical protein
MLAAFESRTVMKLVDSVRQAERGWEIIRQAIERGHFVIALARSPERLSTLVFDDRLGVIKGDPLNRS